MAYDDQEEALSPLEAIEAGLNSIQQSLEKVDSRMTSFQEQLSDDLAARKSSLVEIKALLNVNQHDNDHTDKDRAAPSPMNSEPTAIQDQSMALQSNLRGTFGWLSDEDWTLAYTGKLPALDLAKMIDPTSEILYYFPAVDSTASDARRSKCKDAFTMFLKSFTHSTGFLFAWDSLITIMQAGCQDHDPSLALSLGANMRAYGHWLVELVTGPASFTWESIMLYHVRFVTSRFSIGASDPAKWSNFADPKLTVLLVPHSPVRGSEE